MAEASKAKSSTKDGAAAKKKTVKQAVSKEDKSEKPKAKSEKNPEIAQAIDTEQLETTSHKPKTTDTAKAGKRSVKAIKEVEEKEAKEERKATAKTDATKEKPKVAIKPARSRTERRGKKYRESAKLVDRQKLYDLTEALDLAIKTAQTKFDSSVEMHIRLGVDPRQADQNIRDTVVLPAGTGKTVRVAVFAEEDNAKKAIKSGADFAGNEDFLAKLDKNQIDFDVLIATPNLMAKLAKYARILGPKGLMPNPKSGTVTADVVKAVEQARAGRIEYRVDSTGIVHAAIGKASFGRAKLSSNAQALLSSIKQNKPASLKNVYVRSITVTTTMGPGIKITATEIS